MKKIILLSIFLCISFHFSYSQKSKVKDAINYYSEPLQEYDKAKEAIDEAVNNEQTKNLDKAWYYRGLIYHALYNSEKYKDLCNQCLETSYVAFMKVNEINPKNEWVEEINAVRLQLLMRDFFNRGVIEFNNKEYKNALASFEMVQRITPNDTSVILNSALAATQAKEYQKAKQYYNRLISMNYKDISVYMALSKIYSDEKDTVRALLTVQDGRKIYPDSIVLLNNEINYLIVLDKNKEAVDLLDEAIKKEPKNSRLCLVQGITYEKLANPKDAAGNDLPKPINYTEYMTKIEQSYQKGLQITPDDYILNYFLGLFYFNQGAEMFNKANSIKDPKQYDVAKENFERMFRQAQPYLEKAYSLNPKNSADDKDNYEGTIDSLRQLYARTNQTDKYKQLPEKK